MYFYVMKLEFEVDSNEAIIQISKIIYTENYQRKQLFMRNMVLKLGNGYNPLSARIYLGNMKYSWIFYQVSILHCSNVIMNAMASQINGVAIVCSNAWSGTDGRKHQRSAFLAFVRVIQIHRWPVDSPHKGPVTRKCFPVMMPSWAVANTHSRGRQAPFDHTQSVLWVPMTRWWTITRGDAIILSGSNHASAIWYNSLDPLLLTWFNFNEITYPFLNFNGATVEV